MPTVTEARKRLSWCKGQHVAVAIWSEEDVFSRAEERGLKVTKEQAAHIMDTIDHKQDCTLGITWDTIDIYTDAELAGEVI